MPFSSDELSRIGHFSLDANLRTAPTDQIGVEHPLLMRLLADRVGLPGGLQYITQQVLKNYGSNYQRFRGDQQVTYNRRNLLDDAQFPWFNAHDGFSLNRDELRQNGVIIDDNSATRNAPGADEKLRLHNLLETNMRALRSGFDESRDLELHRDGTQATDAPVGLDGLVKLDPTAGTVGGLDQAVKTYWRNYYSTAISTATQGNLLLELRKGYRACTRNGGRPDFILMGSDMIDAFYSDAKGDIVAYQQVPGKGGRPIDPGVTDLAYKGIPIVWDPVFADLDAADAPATAWEKRCYFLNMKHLTYMADKPTPHKPPRVYDRYTFYWAMTVTDALVADRLNGHAVFAIQ